MRGRLSGCRPAGSSGRGATPTELYGAITRLRTAGGEPGAGRSIQQSGLMRSPSTAVVEDSYSAHFHPRRSGSTAGGALAVEGLQMSSEDTFRHRPVMAGEVVELLVGVPSGTVVDATVGGGGHSRAILESHPGVTVLGIDADEEAVAAATAELAEFGSRARVVQGRFDALAAIVRARGAEPVTGVLFDLGVSSHQLDVARRGFSYRQGGPLDMRMDASGGLTAADVVNAMDPRHLAELIAANGEPVYARAIARAIVAARPLSTTLELAEAVKSAIPARARRHGGHPATRVFQAIRIAVNGELDVLRAALGQALDVVVPSGRICVISYHSGEDRIVKRAFVEAVTGGCSCPSGLPCVCGARPRAAFVRRSGAIRPSEAEVASNRRAASARLRVVEVVPAPELR